MKDKQIAKFDLSRREVLKYGLYGGLAGGLAPAFWLGGCSRRWRQKRANVIVIVLDTARADRFSFMGYKRNTSPNIDAMASEGVIYERAYAPACWTLPSHASLLTGLYPLQAGATSETLQLPPSSVTLAEVLKEAGYDTVSVVCNSWLSEERGFSQGFTEYHEMWRQENKPDPTQSQDPTEFFATEKVITSLKARQATKKPFFIFVNLNGIHLPYQPREPFLSQFIGNRGYNNQEVNKVAAITSMWRHLAGKIKLNERDFRIMNDLYDGEVALADYFVGQIIEQLRVSGILDDTLVIITSDHGENLGEHGRIDHNLSMYETTLHIPLVIRYPKRFKSGSRITDLVSLMDIAPTILDVCNVSGGMENLKPAEMSLARDDRSPRRFIVAGNERPLTGVTLMKNKYPEFEVSSIDHKLRAIRTDTYKLIWTVDNDLKLFNLRTDPDEINNLSGADIDTREKLYKILVNWFNQIAEDGNSFFLESHDEESLKILRSLGYVE